MKRAAAETSAQDHPAFSKKTTACAVANYNEEEATMTTQTVQPNKGNPILRWVRGKIVGTIKFAFNHPIEAAVLAFLLWIALTGLADANWSAVPQNGIAQTVIAGEQQAFQEKVGVHMPAISAWVGTRLGELINFTSLVAATWMAQFMSRFMQEFTQYQAQPAPVVVTPTPQHK
jgi:hypothetical protein